MADSLAQAGTPSLPTLAPPALDDALKAISDALILRLANMDMHSDDPDITEEDAILNRTIYDSGAEEPEELEEGTGTVSNHQDGTTDHPDAEVPLNVSCPELTPADIERTFARKAEHEETLRRHVRAVVGDTLLYDPYILETAEELNIRTSRGLRRIRKAA
ncbi:unnamed protein product [Mortierella alpina]